MHVLILVYVHLSMSMYRIVSVLSCNTIFKMFVVHRLGSEQSQSHHPKHPSPSLPPFLTPDVGSSESGI